jgi:hypothetical protein
MAVGVPAVWLFEDDVVQMLGVVSLVVGAVLMGTGVYRFFSVRAEIARDP